jgi:hypothetical protein
VPPSPPVNDRLLTSSSPLLAHRQIVNCEYQTLNQLSPPPGLSSSSAYAPGPGARGGYDHEELVTLLSRLRQTIKSVVIASMEKPQLRHASKSSRRRAEVMQAILRLGDRVVESVGEDSKRGDWEQLRDTFLQMMMEE